MAKRRSQSRKERTFSPGQLGPVAKAIGRVVRRMKAETHWRDGGSHLFVELVRADGQRLRLTISRSPKKADHSARVEARKAECFLSGGAP